MPRIARKDYKANYFHIIVQGINKEWIFKKEKYLKKYRELLLDNKEKYAIKLVAYCIMNNHAHLLIYCDKVEELSQYMKSINTSYANYYNAIEERVGHVFRNRYEAEEIDSERYLLNCIAYIHNNPVKAGIVKNVSNYKYSTYNNYINKTGIVTNEILKLVFGTSNNYLEQYKIIHKKDYSFKDMIEAKKSVAEIIREYEQIRNTKIEKIKENEKYVIELAKRLMEEAGLSMNKISKILELSRYKLMKILNKDN